MSTKLTVPQNVAAEEAYLGACWIEPDTLITNPLPSEAFYLQKHRWIYEAMKAVHARNAGLDFLSVATELEHRDQLDAVGGPAYLGQLMEATENCYYADRYAQLIIDPWKKRNILDVAGELARQAHNGKTPDEIISFGAQSLTDLSAGTPTLRSASDGAYSVLTKAEYYRRNPLRPGEVRGINTGWADMNTALGGYFRGNVYYIYAAEHVGKTWALVNMLSQICESNGRALFFSLEMSADTSTERMDKNTLWERFVLSRAGIKLDDYRAGCLNAAQYNAFGGAVAEIDAWDLKIDDSARSIEQITATIHRENRRQKLDVVAIDYLGLLEADFKAPTRNEFLGKLTRSLKELANATDIVLLVPHQVSSKELARRENKRPTIESGYESGHIAQDADVVFNLYRDELYNQETDMRNIIECTVLKDRPSGHSGRKWHWYWDPYCRFRPARVQLAE